MKCFIGIIYLHVLIIACDFKSVNLNKGSGGENKVNNIPLKKNGETQSANKNELDELKANIGKVGNKLESIIYEVLKDFLSEEYETEPIKNSTNSSILLKEKTGSKTINSLKKYDNGLEQNNSSISENELVQNSGLNRTKTITDQKLDMSISDTLSHSNDKINSSKELILKDIPNLSPDDEFYENSDEYGNILDNELSTEQTNIERNGGKTKIQDHLLSGEENDSVETINKNSNQDQGLTEQFTTEIMNTSKDVLDSIAEKPTRRRRMVPEHPEQIRSVENFIESNPESMLPPPRTIERPGEQIIIREYHVPEDEQRRTSHRKLDQSSSVRNSEKKENSEYSENFNRPSKKLKSLPEGGKHLDIQGEPIRKLNTETSDQPMDVKENHHRKKISLENEEKINGKVNFKKNSEDQDNARLGQSFQWGPHPTSCYDKNESEDLLEKQHIEDLKYEVSKLRSVVDLLREQQSLINSFDKNDKSNNNEQQMLNVLNELNNKEKPVSSDIKTDSKSGNAMNKAKHEELGIIKHQLQEAIDNLNRTKEILNLEHEKELNLENELKSQKTEINWLKLIMENFIIEQTKKKLKSNKDDIKAIEDNNKHVNETDNHIVGARFPSTLRNRNHTIPSTVKMAEERLRELAQKRSRESFMNDSKDREISRRLTELRVDPPQSRSSELSTIGRLLDTLSDKQSKTDDDDDGLQLKLLEAVSELRKIKEKDHLTRDLLKKLQNGRIESKTDDDDLLLKIQKALKSLDPPQSKNDELDIEDQLKILQRQIDRLKPNDELDLIPSEPKAPINDPVQFQAMLTKLIAENPQFQGMKLPPITPQQLIQLQKKFNTRPGVPSLTSLNGDSGWPAGLMNSYPGSLGKLGPLFGPYSPGYGAYGSTVYGPGNGYFGGGSAATYSGLGHGPGYPLASYGLYGAPKVGYGGGYSPNLLAVPYKSAYGSQSYAATVPYGPKIDQYASDKPTYTGSNFFQVPQPNSYGSGPPSPYFPSTAIDGQGPEKFYANQLSYAGTSAPYAADKIEDLKTQIYGLQSAISSYNRPEYTQTPEDKNTIYNLEQQIDELKGIVTTLNGYPGDTSSSGNLYDSSGYGSPSDQSIPDGYNRESDNRNKRSQARKTGAIETEQRSIEGKLAQNSIDSRQDDSWWNKMTSAFKKNFLDESNTSPQSRRRKRSIADNSIEESRTSGVMDKLASALRDVLDESEEPPQKKFFQPLPINTMTRGSMTRPSSPSSIGKHTSLQDIKKQIDNLKKQLGHKKSERKFPEIPKIVNVPTAGQIEPISSRHAVLPEPTYNYNYGLNQFPSDLTLKPKKLDIFKGIVAKIMDKVIESLPVILQKLFGFAVHELTAYGDDYGASYGAYGSDGGMLSVFRNLGVFGYLPLIILRLVHALSTFIYILQKNKFLKYFLIPAGLVLVVSGSMVFLIWWMQPGDYYLNYEKSYDKVPYSKDYSYDYDNSNDYEKSSKPVIKTYEIEEGKQRNKMYSHDVANNPSPISNVPYPLFYKPHQFIDQFEHILPTYNE